MKFQNAKINLLIQTGYQESRRYCRDVSDGNAQVIEVLQAFAGTVRLAMPDIRTRGKHGPNEKPDKEERIGQSCKEHAGKDSEQPEFASQKEFEAANPVHLLARDVPVFFNERANH